jgi:hypothetical protein
MHHISWLLDVTGVRIQGQEIVAKRCLSSQSRHLCSSNFLDMIFSIVMGFPSWPPHYVCLRISVYCPRQGPRTNGVWWRWPSTTIQNLSHLQEDISSRMPRLWEASHGRSKQQGRCIILARKIPNAGFSYHSLFQAAARLLVFSRFCSARLPCHQRPWWQSLTS